MPRPSKSARSSVGPRRLTAALALLALLVVGLPAAPAAAAETGTIASNGPLSTIVTSPDLNCDVRYGTDTSAEFYGGTACATLVSVGGTLYGPAAIPAGSGAGPRTSYTPVSQTGPTGAGTPADPFKIVTTVSLDGSGVRLTQTDTYVNGQESYRTDVSLANSSGSSVTALVYRAGDCYLANSDYGLGQVTDNSVACLSSGNRVEQWIPLTGGSHYYEAGYSEVWARIGAQQAFPDTCRCDENIDNGAGLSWQLTIAASGTGRASHLTAFSPSQAQADRDGDGLLDDWETNGLDLNGDGRPDVDLPAMGASPDHKDVFVEADWMIRPASCTLWIFNCTDARSFAPNQSALADVRAAMAAAPVTNLDGTNGIRAHIDSGPSSVMNPVTGATWGTRSRANNVGHVRDLGSFSNGRYDWVPYNNLKNANFDPNRRDVFHYALYGDRFAGIGSSGIAQTNGARTAADAFLVTDGNEGSWGSGFTRRQESGTFMHEFGHTLGLGHGGIDDQNNKPNYLSIMNYLYQLGDGNPRPLDYSRSAVGPLDERSLAEQDGLLGGSGNYAWFCPGNVRRDQSGSGPADWDCDGTPESGRIQANLSGDERVYGNSSLASLAGYDDWSHLIYTGGAVGAFGADDLEDQDPPPTSTVFDEPTAEQLKAASSYGADGDGSVRVVGPNVLFAAVTGQTIQVNVTNVGSTEARYQIAASGVDAVATTTPVTVAAGATVRATLAVDGSKVRVGGATLTLVLTAAGSATELATDSIDVSVPDLSDPAVRAAADDALAQLPTTDGFDPAVKTGLVSAASAALGTGQVDRITLTPANPTTTAGQPVSFTVTGRDAGGRPTGDLTSASQLTTTAPASCQSGSCLATKPGTYPVTATYQGKTATAQLTVTAAAPATVTTVGGDQQSVAAGKPFPTPLKVKVVDSYNNPVAGTGVTFAVATGSASFTTTTSTTAASVTVRTGSDGTATATTLTAGSDAGPLVVTATAGTASVGFLESITAAGTGPADLKVSLTAPLTARPGQVVNVTAKVSNVGTGSASNVRTVIALPRGTTITDAGGGTVRGTLVLKSASSLAPGQQATFTIKAKFATTAQRLSWVAALTGSSSKEVSYRNNGAVSFVAVR